MNQNVTKKYNVIYADPPWNYNSRSGRDFKHAATDKYSTLSLEDIKNLPVQKITQDDAVCFLWATVPLLPQALEVLQAWGFQYKTKLTWDKKAITTGFWFRNQVEDLLMGIKGKVKPFGCQKANIFQCMYGRHSQKPDYFRNLISEVVTTSFFNPMKLELFARSRGGLFPDDEYKGWDVWGNEVNNSI